QAAGSQVPVDSAADAPATEPRCAVRFLRRLVIVVAIVAIALRLTLGGGDSLEDRTGAPTLPSTALEVVADLPLPPGNIAVAKDGRVFFTFHPEGHPPIKLAELVGGKPVAYPNEDFQSEKGGAQHFQTPLAVRVDRQGRLWVLDYGNYGLG